MMEKADKRCQTQLIATEPGTRSIHQRDQACCLTTSLMLPGCPLKAVMPCSSCYTGGN